MLKVGREASGVAVVQFEGRLDRTTAPDFGDQLAGLVRAGNTRVVVDLARVTYISSAGFRSLLIAGKLVDEAAGKLALRGLNPEVRRLSDVGAFTERFVVRPSREGGIRYAE